MKKVVLYSFRYMWTIKGATTVNFKIVTDIEQGLEKFEEQLKALPDLEKAGKEYICSYEVDMLGKFIDIINV